MSSLKEAAYILHRLIGKAHLAEPRKVKVTIEFERQGDRFQFTDSAIKSQPWFRDFNVAPPYDLTEIELEGIKFEFKSRAKRVIAHPDGNYEVPA